MRKVKILALVLAMLMVAAAFAGCAGTKEIESDVAGLDQRVEALENQLGSANDKLDDIGDQLKDDTTDADIKALQDALKAQAEAQTAILNQIKDLNDKIGNAEDKNDELSDDIKELTESLAATNRQIGDLASTVAGLAGNTTNNADAVKALQEALEKALKEQKEANEALKDAILGTDPDAPTHEDRLDALEGILGDISTALGNLSQQLEDLKNNTESGREEDKEDSAEAEKAQSDAQATIQTLVEWYNRNSVHYLLEDRIDITTWLNDAWKEIDEKVSAAKVEEIMDELWDNLRTKKRVDDVLYDYILKLDHICDGTAALEAEAWAWYATVQLQYAGNWGYVTAYDPNHEDIGQPEKTAPAVTVDLEAAIEAIHRAQTGNMALQGTLNNIKDRAVKLDKAIEAVGEVLLAKRGTVEALVIDYEIWKTEALALCDVCPDADLCPECAGNVAFVTKADKLYAMKDRLDELALAEALFKKIGDIDLENGVYLSVFKPYDDLVATEVAGALTTIDEERLLLAGEEKVADIYADINARIAAWAGGESELYKWAPLSQNQINEIVALYKGGTAYYVEYKADNARANEIAAAYAEFVKIAARIVDFNKASALTKARFDLFDGIYNDIHTLLFATKANGGYEFTGETDDVNFQQMVVKSGLKATYDKTVADSDAEWYLSLYTFKTVNEEVFYNTTYRAARTNADALNDRLIALNEAWDAALEANQNPLVMRGDDTNGDGIVDANILTNQWDLYTLGYYVAQGGTSYKLYTTQTDEILTIVVDPANDCVSFAEFEARYRILDDDDNDDTDFYDLTCLLKIDLYNEVYAKFQAYAQVLQTLANTVTAEYGEIMAVVTTADELDVTLTQEQKVNAAYDVFEDWYRRGGRSNLPVFSIEPVAKDAVDNLPLYSFEPTLTRTVYEGIQTLEGEVNRLKNVAEYVYDLFLAIDIADRKTEFEAIHLSSYKVADAHVDLNTKTQIAALTFVWEKYNDFVAQNGGETYNDTVEDANGYAPLVDAFNAFLDNYALTALKSLAYDQVLSKNFDPADIPAYTKGEHAYNAFKDTALKHIAEATNESILADYIKEFVVETGASINAIVFVGTEFIAANGASVVEVIETFKD